ncbi:hypothetical protein [Chitinophaga sp. HK235]|uniref:hypothetical protein n=1 Tax=Chitinophaga sp. HK235 TaxID=2952571 RepID=UPI001BAD32A4|nr:hypothetical protein [Chitinophaga sp. HK235]
MINLLEVQFAGWTATPRMPFVVSGNAVCLPAPSYSLLLGLISCCLGRLVEAGEVAIGCYYRFDYTAKDMETRHRLAFDGRQLKPHQKGTDVHLREFHVQPRLTLWLDQPEWADYFRYPAGTPSLGRSQDILRVTSVKTVAASKVAKGTVSGCMLPFGPQIQAGGQLVQMAEAYRENDGIGTGRTATRSGIFIAVPWDSYSPVSMPDLYEIAQEGQQEPICFYLHPFKHER